MRMPGRQSKGKLAYWINAYNALTVQGILDVYPTSSIRNHTAKLVGYNIWDDLLLPVGDNGTTRSTKSSTRFSGNWANRVSTSPSSAPRSVARDS